MIGEMSRALLMVVLCGACRSNADERDAPAEQDAASRAECQSDEECPGGFCDREGECGTLEDRTSRGRTCKRAPELPSGMVDGKLNVCGAYLCIDGRCRSCRTDRECELEYGAPRCAASEDGSGRSCGL